MHHLTHGEFSENATIAQQLRDVLRASPHWSRALDYQQREAIDQIISCMANIINGDAAYEYHWIELAGHAMEMVNHLGDDDEDGGDPDPEPERRRTLNIPPPALAQNVVHFHTLPPTARLKTADVLVLKNVGRATLYRHILAGTFPAPHKTPTGMNYWLVGDVRAALEGVEP